MAMPIPQKIVLKNSTSLTLNDRFTKIGTIRPPNRQNIKQLTLNNLNAASLQNQRLAQRFANRNMVPLMRELPIINRLGILNVKARLGYSRGRGLRMQRTRGVNQFIQRPRRGFSTYRGNASIRNNYNNLRGVSKGRGRINKNIYNNYIQTPRAGRGRGRGGRGRGRGGRGRGVNIVKESKTVEQLDTELDTYMGTS